MMVRYLFVILGILALHAPARDARAAATIDTAATSAVLIDVTSGTTLLEKNPDIPIPPASMSKLMTVNMVFEALQSGRLTLDEQFTVSEKAWRMGGSKMFVRVGDRISVRDLLHGAIIQSGNDACIVLAEGLAGTEERFADQMTRRAKELGMTGSTFANATGWPAPGHRMTARDLALIAERIVTQFPEYYDFYSKREFTWEGITQRNRNPLLNLDLGADGLKTGHTEEAGYGLVGSAMRDGRRLILVVTGLPSSATRAREAAQIINWGFRDFETIEIARAGAVLGEAPVWIGESRQVPLAATRGVIVTVPYGRAKDIRAEIRYDGPAPAPVRAGDAIAILRIIVPDMPVREIPLAAAADVARGGFGVKLRAAGETLLGRAMAFAFPDRGEGVSTE